MTIGFKFTNASWPNGVDLDDVYVRADAFRTGGLYMSGDGQYGQYGIGDVVSRSSPIQLTALGFDWKTLAEKTNNDGIIAAIKTDGTLWLWGRNFYGQLGDETTVAKSSPVQTVAGGKWKSVISTQSTIAIKDDGTLWTWGFNTNGRLGDGTTTNRSSPVQTVAGGNTWKQISGGGCVGAIKTDGTLWMWGRNTSGTLGDGTITDSSSPSQTIAGGTNWKQVSCDTFVSAAIKTDGTLWMWGRNIFGNLGDGTITDRSSPVQTIAGGNNWKQVCVDTNSSAAIKTDGTLWAWGVNSSGQIGDGTAVNKSSPVQTVAAGNNWKQVSVGTSLVVALKSNGTLWGWGGNPTGQLGDGTLTNKSSPIQIMASGNNWKQVTGGAAVHAISYD